MSDEELRCLILKRLETIDERVCRLLSEVAALKVKASIWGMAGGVMTVAAAMGIWAIRSVLN